MTHPQGIGTKVRMLMGGELGLNCLEQAIKEKIIGERFADLLWELYRVNKSVQNLKQNAIKGDRNACVESYSSAMERITIVKGRILSGEYPAYYRHIINLWEEDLGNEIYPGALNHLVGRASK